MDVSVMELEVRLTKGTYLHAAGLCDRAIYSIKTVLADSSYSFDVSSDIRARAITSATTWWPFSLK